MNMVRLTVGLCFSLMAVSVAWAQTQATADPITGVWDTTFEGSGIGPYEFALDLKLDQGKISGQSKGSMAMAITEGQLDGTKVSFILAGQFGNVQMNGTMSENTISGEWSMLGSGLFKGTWKASRKATAPAAPASAPAPAPAPTPAAPATPTTAGAATTEVWDCVFDAADMGKVPMTLTLNRKNDEVMAAVESAIPLSVLKLSQKDNTLTILANSEYGEVNITGEMKGDKMTGTWYLPSGGASGTWEATRRQK
jgi:hypothetical protein